MSRFIRDRRFDWGYLIVLGLTVPVLWPLVGPAYLSSHDGLHHLFRLLDLDWCIRGAVLYPRWLPHLGFGYGYPVLNYYAPLSYYTAEAFHLLGAGFVDSIKLTYAVGFLGSGVTMYLFAKEHMGRIPGVLAGLVYIYLPYHLADAYVRGALAEFLAFPFFPLTLWCFYKLITLKRPQYVAWGALSLAGLAVTHNLMTLIFAPLLVAYVGFIWFGERDRRGLIYAGLALLLASGLSAFYWLPGFVESSWARLGQVGPSATDYIAKLITMADFFSPHLLYEYFPEQGVSLEHPINWLQFGLLCVSLAVPFRLRRRSQGHAGRHIIFFQWATFISLFMLFTYSRPLWDNIPLLPYLQYPFRFLTLTSLTSAFAIGSLPLLFIKRSEQPGVVSWTGRDSPLWGLVPLAVIVLVLMVTALPGLPIEPQYLPEHEEPLTEEGVNFAAMAEYDYLTGLWARVWGGPWLMEYLPVWVEDEPAEIFLPEEKPPLEAIDLSPDLIPRVTLRTQAALSKELTVATAKPTELSLHTFYFPNWRAYIDCLPTTTHPSGRLGLLTVNLPPGEHEVMIRFEDTPVERAGTIILAASILGLVAILAVSRQWRVLAAALMSTLLVAALLAWHAFSSPSTQAPVPLQANLGDQVKLLGYNLDEPVYRPGDTVNVTLYWLALQDMDKNYKVFVHFTDEAQTGLFAQSDRWPVYNFSPTTRWQLGEIVWDRHEIHIPADQAPGTYRLSTGMYLLETMQNLDVLAADGSRQGVAVPLGTVEVVQ
jgi:hypothetical protein